MTDETTKPRRPGRALWQEILEDLRDDIASGRYPPGTRLPTEARLAQRFGVNRHTVRRALHELREAGQITVRRGSGAVVTPGRFDYPITGRTRFSANVSASGRVPERTILRCETVRASDREAEILALSPGSLVVLYEVATAASGVPVSYGRSVFPASRLGAIAEGLLEHHSVTKALTAVGVADYLRRWTRLTAEKPTPTIANHLAIPEGAAVLHSEGLNVDAAGAPVEYGNTWFCSERVALVVDGAGLASTETAAHLEV